ncbi:hypothetical protein RB195_002187 [Necator americanus]|uniref:Uncharacterized protein n=1 Tax=Necator americanus TaxID=51031 RepID=A0ABR1DIU8_NECAM
MVQTSDDVKLVQSAVRKMLQFKNDHNRTNLIESTVDPGAGHPVHVRTESDDSDTFPLFHLRRICGFTEQLTGSRTSTHVKSAEKNRAGTRRDGGPV